MSRLPPAPDLDWKPDGTPVARGFDDVYFSTADGLEETRAVFLAGCCLPGLWAGRSQFTVAETGFGTGLNFLALWQMWRAHRPAPDAWLDFVSFEGFPLHREDAARALSAWPELSELSQKLLDAWPSRARGVRRLTWPGESVSLTLHIDEISSALPASHFAADAWFLDGFSPSRNGEMWAPELYPQIAARCRPGARLASFTVAGDVRRGLAGAGFAVSKAPGFGYKRDRLEAVFEGEGTAREPTPTRIAILGAGIAGACAARSLSQRGAEVTVFDPAGLGAGASGNPLGLVMPRLDAGDTATARFLIDAYLQARSFYRGLPGVFETDVRQEPRGERETDRFAKLLADPPLDLSDLEALAGGALLHKGALIFRPAELLPALLEGVETRAGAPVSADLAGKRVNGEAFDAVILASGMAIGEVAPWLGLEGRLGQVEHVAGCPDGPASALAAGHYALSLGDERLWGATFEAASGPPEASASAREANRAALDDLSPWWRRQVEGRQVTSRAGIRATTPDRLPVCGPLPDFAASLEALAPLRTGAAPYGEAVFIEAVHVICGLGSRGYTFAPLLGEMLAAWLCDLPQPASAASLETTSPLRAIVRGLKRGVF